MPERPGLRRSDDPGASGPATCCFARRRRALRPLPSIIADKTTRPLCGDRHPGGAAALHRRGQYVEVPMLGPSPASSLAEHLRAELRAAHWQFWPPVALTSPPPPGQGLGRAYRDHAGGQETARRFLEPAAEQGPPTVSRYLEAEAAGRVAVLYASAGRGGADPHGRGGWRSAPRSLDPGDAGEPAGRGLRGPHFKATGFIRDGPCRVSAGGIAMKPRTEILRERQPGSGAIRRLSQDTDEGAGGDPA